MLIRLSLLINLPLRVRWSVSEQRGIDLLDLLVLHGGVVQRGLDWLVSRQGSDGDLRGEETLYSHGIATISLSEAYAITADTSLRDPVERAANFIIRSRNKSVGGWRYDPGQPGDTSVLGWQVMALKSAANGGIRVPPSVFDAAGTWLNRVSERKRPGLYAYQPGQAPTPSMTAEVTANAGRSIGPTSNRSA